MWLSMYILGKFGNLVIVMFWCTTFNLAPTHTHSQTAWLLRAYTSDSWLPSAELQRGNRLLYLLQTEQIRAPPLTRYICTVHNTGLYI